MLAHLVQFMLHVFILMLHVMIVVFNVIFFWLKIKCCMLFKVMVQKMSLFYAYIVLHIMQEYNVRITKLETLDLDINASRHWLQ